MVDKIVSTAPERIYLVGGDGYQSDVDFHELDDVCWYNEPVGTSVEYVRADLQHVSLPMGVPDAMQMEPYQTVDRSSTNYKAGWNACRKAMLAARDAGEVLVPAEPANGGDGEVNHD